MLSEVARTWRAAPDVTATVEAITRAAVSHLQGTEYAGVALCSKGKITTVAATDDLVTEIDQLQYKVGEGPCVDAITHHRTYRTGDLATEGRWPNFALAASAAGVRSMLSYRLFDSSTTIGALTLYSTEPDAFSDDTVADGALFAGHAAIALATAQTEAQLVTALESRDQIATAKGILMERHRLDPAQAFAMLVDASQNSNVKLHDVAAWLIDDTDQLRREFPEPVAG
ncbi:two-component system response regulator [Amycolatopsis mediterranei S699]|uniref:Two-component system response regulator n=1 Tax=Amycolatopsis mediterranei (strain U-32) TaxID=749927 RepID=A0A0H3DDH2_AMYMU|nr:GAF and ANTAR domain-containing protein [Amycolatopsis mediterranei]AGT87096.1 two-component system response regulator [Amycolatopsis mediterranei RB]ADJ48257.1 two-component system response regulator [Amycolatopsis mediterranei U32]AFO79968.1 two-component system response regulator [Amycolatopsis mediterranei S699]KDO10412.1 antitermination regulator [Amycolatopsis mediterranei]KDU86658.1 antitermination regulator [Amycolatopsis mediterranei]